MSADYRHRDTHRHETHSALRLALSVFLAVAVVAWALGCDDSHAPTAVGEIPELTVEVGTTESVDLAGYFSDPDGDELGYEVSSSNAEVATVAISGGSVAVKGVATGSAGITVKASDGSSSASQDFTVSVPLADRVVLHILYDRLGGDNWTDNTNWKTDKPLGEWYGVRTSAGDRVVRLALGENSLTGTIPPELGDLSSLKILYLGDDSLIGEIPPELGNLANLRLLVLDRGSLTGAIPPELGSLSNLLDLSLRFNQLTSAIPPDFLNLSALKYFYWYGNDGLCVPDTNEFDYWLHQLTEREGPRCD